MVVSDTLAIRQAGPGDEVAIKQIAVDTGLFTADEVGFFDGILAGTFDGSLEGHSWLVATATASPQHIAGAAYFAPELFSDRMWNLYFLGVAPGRQKQGIGVTLVEHVEQALTQLGAEHVQTLIIETSGTAGFEATRAFYLHLGYDEEARIRDFYGPGDDKVVFYKRLLPSGAA